MENSANCKNCKTPLQGRYCFECGQRVITKRMTVRNLISFVFHAITNVEKGLWFTLRGLLKNPGKVIKEYIGGRTQPYYHPLRLAFVMGTFSIFLFLAFNNFENTQEAYQDLLSPNAAVEAQEFQTKFQERIKPFMNFIPILLIPFYAMISYRFFRKQSFNLAEHMVIHAYNYGIITAVSFPLMILYTRVIPITFAPLFGWSINAIALMIIFRQLFGGSWQGNAFKGLLTTLLGYALFFMAFMLITLIIMIPVIFIQGGLGN